MIDLYGSRLTDVLPASMDSPEMRAFSMALGKQIDALCKYADAARVYADIDGLPDTILDAMAADLRAQAYLESYNIGTKRALIKGTLLFYMQMGTPAAVKRIMEAVFDNGEVVEWWKYGGQPYHYKVTTQYPDYSAAVVARFRDVLATVQRETAVLDAIEFVAFGGTATGYAATQATAVEIVQAGTAIQY